MDTLKTIPWQAEKEAFEAIARIGSYEAMSEEDRQRYDDAQRHYWDSVAVYEAAIEEGVNKGLIMGKEEGRKEGRDEGRKEGELAAKLQIAQALIQQGFSDEIIANATALPMAEITKLRG